MDGFKNRKRRWQQGSLNRLLRRLGYRRSSLLIPLACLIGALTGLGSVGFAVLIDRAHDFCYGPEGLYGDRLFMLLILPAAGALLVGLITYFFAREAKGHGVPEVMDAIARREARIRPRVAVAKAVASALTIGSGGSAGTEGPIIQIGAAIGSALGQVFRLGREQMPVMVGCGAAAGISAIFHAPIAGVLFTLEVFLRDINFRTFAPVLMASVLSSVVAQAVLGGQQAIFPLVRPDITYGFHWSELGNYVVLGLLCAAAAVLLIKALYGFEDFFDWLKVHYVAKPVLGALGLGLLGICTVRLLGQAHIGEPSVFGNGYPLIARCIGGQTTTALAAIPIGIAILMVLLVFKVLATCFTLGSGGSGGVFAPSLFVGAVLGYAFGLLLQRWTPFAGVHPETYALVGMAAVVGATTHAPMAAIIILFEMTHNYHIIIPVMFAVTIALSGAQLLYRDSIYTLKLRRRGVIFESRANTAILRRLTVAMVMNRAYVQVYDDEPLQEVVRKAAEAEAADFVVVDHTGHYVGLLTADDLRAALLQPEALPLLVAGELAKTSVPAVQAGETLDKTLDTFARFDVNCLPVMDSGDGPCVGTVTRAALMRRYQRELTGV